MFRKRSGSILCYACGKLNRADASSCFYCGRRNPGLWGLAPGLGRWMGRLDFAGLVTIVAVAAYVASLLLDPSSLLRARSPFDFLAPSGLALEYLGMTGAEPWRQGRWWTVLTAIYLHGSLLHLVFNLLWIRQMASDVEEVFGHARFIVIFTVSGALGFVLSNFVGVPYTLGASGAIFGLFGAMVYYGRQRGGFFGQAMLKQYGTWALVIFVLGFLPGFHVNNWGHGGGFAGGFLAALVLGAGRSEQGTHRVLAALCLGLTAAAFALALWTAFAG